jgi:hypothetical protein
MFLLADKAKSKKMLRLFQERGQQIKANLKIISLDF